MTPLFDSASEPLPRGALLSWTFALILLWAAGLFYRGLWTPDEPREADIAWHMSQQSDKSLAQFAGTDFAEKPPLSYWMSAASIDMLGNSPAALRAPNMLYLLLTAGATGLLLAAMRSRRAMLIGVLMACSTFELMRVGIWLATDAGLVAGCAVALAGLYRGYVTTDGRQKMLWYTVMHAGSLMAFMTKSGIGWIVPGLTLITLIAWEGRWQELRRPQLWLGFFLQLSVIGIWIGAVLHQPDGVNALRALFWNNLAGRFAPVAYSALAPDYTLGHRNWPGKYLLEMPYYLLPWSLLAVGAGARFLTLARQRALDTAWRFAVAAWLPFVVLLSLAATARDVYFAPAILGLSVFIALWLEQLETKLATFDAWILRGTRWLVAALGIATLAALYKMHGESSGTERLQEATAGVVISAVLAISIARSSHAQRMLHFHTAVAWCGLGFVSALLIASLVLFPVIDRWQDLGSIARGVERDVGAGELAVLNSDETTIAMLDYYTHRPAVAVHYHTSADQYAVGSWLSADPRHRLLALQGRSSEHDAVESLLQNHIAIIVARYQLPHGRSYLLLADAATSDRRFRHASMSMRQPSRTLEF